MEKMETGWNWDCTGTVKGRGAIRGLWYTPQS